MSEETLNIGIIADTSQAKRELNEVDAQINTTNQNLDETKEKAKSTLELSVMIMRGVYTTLRGALKMMGITIDGVTNAIITSALNVGHQLASISHAYKTLGVVNPVMMAVGIAAGAQAAFVIYTAFQHEQDRKTQMQTIEATNLLLSSVVQGVGIINW